jgi:histidinol-phosphate aminotransferase
VHKNLAAVQGIKVYESDANFLFIEAGRSYSAIAKELERQGIAVKLLGNVAGHAGCMRVTIGTKEMNDRFLACVGAATK